MAPELVQQQPYNYTVDLWSLGVILYELYVGQPPFYTNSIYSLISLIVNETVKWPTGMSANFKSFLQGGVDKFGIILVSFIAVDLHARRKRKLSSPGLLNKSPTRRLAWPKLAEHPFVKTTEPELRVSGPFSSVRLSARLLGCQGSYQLSLAARPSDQAKPHAPCL